MIITDPMRQVQKVCRMCGTIFVSEQYKGKLYCSVKCRKRAKNIRESGRSPEQVTVQMQQESPYFASVNAPTNVQLDKYAELVKMEMTDGKPVRFTNVNIMWTPPEGIIFNLSQKLNITDPDEWLMFHTEMIDNLLTSTTTPASVVPSVHIEKPKKSPFRVTKQILDNL
jgi:hypothetical protein